MLNNTSTCSDPLYSDAIDSIFNYTRGMFQSEIFLK